MTGKFILLGSGNSSGVPAIGNDWGKCDPDEPRNRRTRPGAVVEKDDFRLLVDMGPDLSYQLTREEIKTVDAVLLTHAHADHVNGIDDIRTIRFRIGYPLPLYGLGKHIDELGSHFPYAFGKATSTFYKAYLEPKPINEKQIGFPYTIGPVEFTPFMQDHGTCRSLGFRFGSLGYSTDMLTLDEKAIEILKGVDTWIADGASYKNPNPVHATLEEVYRLNSMIGAKKVYITHLPRNMDYMKLCEELPAGYEPAYDGLVIPFD